ncbi:creatininase family protein [Roseateles sp. P5_D6]
MPSSALCTRRRARWAWPGGAPHEAVARGTRTGGRFGLCQDPHRLHRSQPRWLRLLTVPRQLHGRCVVHDLLDSLDHQGFRRILIVNGHGGNQPVAAAMAEWMAAHPRTRVRFHNWWNSPKTLAHVKAIDPHSAHASWMENLPWTRLAGVTQPEGRKPPVDYQRYAVLAPDAARELAGDGNFGGAYERPDAEVLEMWRIAVEETRALINGPWA